MPKFPCICDQMKIFEICQGLGIAANNYANTYQSNLINSDD